MPKFSANLGFLWPDRPLLQRMDAAAAAGFRAIELHWPYDIDARAIAARCEQHGLQLLGINTPAGDFAAGERGLGAVVGREADFRRAFDETLIYALAAGASAIHVMAGAVAEADRPAAATVFKQNLCYAADRVSGTKITLLLEPLNRSDNPGYFYSRVSEAAELIEALALPNLKLQFDAYHVAMVGDDVLTQLAAYRAIIGNVQIASAPRRAEPDEGSVDYRVFFAALDAQHYSGWVGCEYRPRGDTDDGLRWFPALLGSVLK